MVRRHSSISVVVVQRQRENVEHVHYHEVLEPMPCCRLVVAHGHQILLVVDRCHCQFPNTASINSLCTRFPSQHCRSSPSVFPWLLFKARLPRAQLPIHNMSHWGGRVLLLRDNQLCPADRQRLNLVSKTIPFCDHIGNPIRCPVFTDSYLNWDLTPVETCLGIVSTTSCMSFMPHHRLDAFSIRQCHPELQTP